VGFFYRTDLHQFISIEDDLSIFEKGLFESLFLKLKAKDGGRDTVVGAIYMPTGQRVERDKVFDYIDEVSQKIDRKKYDCILVGDMNIDLMQYGTDSKVDEYVDHLVSSGFKFRLIQPTRISHDRASLIDHVLDNMDGRTVTSGVITTQLYGAKGWTDHYPIYTVVKRPVPIHCGPKTKTKRKINQTTEKLFKQTLAATDFTTVTQGDANEALEEMMCITMETYDQCFPLQTVKVYKYEQTKTFMTTGLIKSCKTEDWMLRNMSKNKIKKNSPYFSKFKQYRNLLTTLIRKQKKSHYDEKFEKHKNDIRKTLDLVKNMIHMSNDKHSLTSSRFDINGKWTEDDTEIANGFNKFFAEVGPTTESQVPMSKKSPKEYLDKHSNRNQKDFSLTKISAAGVVESCQNIQKKTSCDHYGLSQKLLLQNIDTLAPLVAHIWNQSIQDGVFPQGGKMAKVVPVFIGKNLDETLFTNYRPISLLPVVGKC
jgi:hypothetical protein